MGGKVKGLRSKNRQRIRLVWRVQNNLSQEDLIPSLGTSFCSFILAQYNTSGSTRFGISFLQWSKSVWSELFGRSRWAEAALDVAVIGDCEMFDAPDRSSLSPIETSSCSGSGRGSTALEDVRTGALPERMAAIFSQRLWSFASWPRCVMIVDVFCLSCFLRGLTFSVPNRPVTGFLCRFGKVMRLALESEQWCVRLHNTEYHGQLTRSLIYF